MSRSFTVETRGQAVAIFGGPKNLVSTLIKELEERGVHSLPIASEIELENLRQTHDPDYLIIFSGWRDDSLMGKLQGLIDSGESRLITLAYLGEETRDLPLHPVSKQIYFSDYVGETELSSKLVGDWLESIKTHHSLVVAGDGLEEISLLGLTDLARLIALSILHPTSGVGETTTLGNPNPISLLNLAYLIRTNLPYKIALTFAPEKIADIWEYDHDSIESALTKLTYTLTEDPELTLKFYLKSLRSELVPAASVKEKITLVKPEINPPAQVIKEVISREIEAKPVVKKLTPLSSSQPFFVPLQDRKVKKSLALKLKLPFTLNPRTKSLEKLGPLRLRAVVGRGLLIASALYLGTLAFSATIAGLSLRNIYNTLRDDQLPISNRLNSFSLTYLRANWLVITSVGNLSKNQSVSDINLMLDAYTQALSVFDSAQSLGRSASDLTGYIFGSGNADIAKVISLSRIQSEEFYQKLSLLDGSLPPTPPTIIPAKYQPYYTVSKTRLAELKRSVATTKALLSTAPDIIGLGGRRKYAVLFQNNMELRATGGFIGSFAILSFENGKLYDMPIYDVYDADGQLKGHVEPPLAIKEILGEANWYLRDSNFDPDFPTSARRAEWFIKKSINQDLDGTVAVNINTLISLLKAIGPIEVTDYNETITGDNLYERSQFHAEVNFFPGSTQKKEFLSTVADALFTRLPTLDGSVGLKAIGALATSVQEKNTLVSLTSPTTEHVMQTLGWNGGLTDSPCPSTGTCHKDYAMVVDSNFGVNKANYFIKRNIEEVITFDKNLAVSHVLRVNYHNTSTSTAWPAGAYKNYQRLYLPVGSNIMKISLGDKILAPKDYAITSEHGKLVVAYLVTIPINEKLEVSVEYTTPQLSQESDLLYTWYWQKQSGTSSSDQITVYLNYPMYLKPAIVSPEAELATQQLKFNMLNDTDRRVTVKFTK